MFLNFLKSKFTESSRIRNKLSYPSYQTSSTYYGPPCPYWKYHSGLGYSYCECIYNLEGRNVDARINARDNLNCPEKYVYCPHHIIYTGKAPCMEPGCGRVLTKDEAFMFAGTPAEFKCKHCRMNPETPTDNGNEDYLFDV